MTPRLRLRLRLRLLLAGIGIAGATTAACPPEPGRSLADSRFPQEVRTGTLIGRLVLRPEESQPVLGRVRAVVRTADGIGVVMSYGGMLSRFGGVWGWGARPIAVPLGAMTLLGADMEVVGLGPAQLDALPDHRDGDPALPADTPVCVGLSRPSH